MRLPCFLLLGLASGAGPAAGQCLPLATLATIAHTNCTPAALKALLPEAEWRFDGAGGAADQARELHWSWDPTSRVDASPTVLTIRPNSTFPGRSDLVLRTIRGACVRQLSHALGPRAPQPVTCLACEGQRYQQEEYTVSIYTYAAPKDGHPYVIVVRYVAPPTPADGSSPATADTLRRPGN